MAANSDVRDATWSNGMPVNPTSTLTGVRPPCGPYGNRTATPMDSPIIGNTASDLGDRRGDAAPR
jgi:hypothetical protein